MCIRAISGDASQTDRRLRKRLVWPVDASVANSPCDIKLCRAYLQFTRCLMLAFVSNTLIIITMIVFCPPFAKNTCEKGHRCETSKFCRFCNYLHTRFVSTLNLEHLIQQIAWSLVRSGGCLHNILSLSDLRIQRWVMKEKTKNTRN